MGKVIEIAKHRNFKNQEQRAAENMYLAFENMIAASCNFRESGFERLKKAILRAGTKAKNCHN